MKQNQKLKITGTIVKPKFKGTKLEIEKILKERDATIHLMPGGYRPVVTVFGKTLPEVWETSVLATYLYGIDIKTHYDKPGDPPSKDCKMTMVIQNPFQEPRLHRCFPAGLNVLEIYRQEVIEGVHDHWIAPKEGKWTYTYHKRLFDYILTNDAEEQNKFFVKFNPKITALRDYFRSIIADEKNKIAPVVYAFVKDIAAVEASGDVVIKLKEMFRKYSSLFENVDENSFIEKINSICFIDPILPSHSEKMEEVHGINQIDYIIDELSAAPYSRRAEGITWMPTADPQTNDPPCLQRVWCRMFPDRHGQQVLNTDTDWRSRDSYGAAFMNIFALTDLQKCIAQRISEKIKEPVKIGPYTDSSNSYHIYGKDHVAFEKFLESILKRKFKDRVWTSEFAKDIFEEERKQLAENPDYAFKR